jgi:hypothetical protein
VAWSGGAAAIKLQILLKVEKFQQSGDSAALLLHIVPITLSLLIAEIGKYVEEYVPEADEIS